MPWRSRTGSEPRDEGAGPGSLLQHFYNLIKLKLGHMEEDMANRDDRTPADNERDTRALGTLIRNFEKVFGLERGQGNDDDTATGRGARGHDEQAEAEAIRRELAERLDRAGPLRCRPRSASCTSMRASITA